MPHWWVLQSSQHVHPMPHGKRTEWSQQVRVRPTRVAPATRGTSAPPQASCVPPVQSAPLAATAPRAPAYITNCAPGFQSSRTGQTSIAPCEPCNAGTYCIHSGSVNGTVCPAHYYCPEGTVDFLSYPCPPGTFSEATGLYSASQCRNCTVGHYCEGPVSPRPCPAGTYNPFFGGSSNASCIPCEAGYGVPRYRYGHYVGAVLSWLLLPTGDDQSKLLRLPSWDVHRLN